jgi:hypothetical protein
MICSLLSLVNQLEEEEKNSPLSLFLSTSSSTSTSPPYSVNYFGFENGMTMVDGLWANTRDALVADFATVVWRMKLLGINAVRLPLQDPAVDRVALVRRHRPQPRPL